MRTPSARERPLIAANPDAVAEIDLSRAAIAHRLDRADTARQLVDSARSSFQRSGNTAALADLAGVELFLGLRAPGGEEQPESGAAMAVQRRFAHAAITARSAVAGSRLEGTALLADRSALEAVTTPPQEIVAGIKTVAEQKAASTLTILSAGAKIDLRSGPRIRPRPSSRSCTSRARPPFRSTS